ncbi:hypothetical protein [Tunturibacter empetritectus]|uniref:Uncharacterized protein n=1 Tax=Tunturiibacter empetritectus TaxID=3069691 RepID=A0A7W8IHN1_9BACT|nr:hypothetical protein [Edaphobacter lichenicola]MBB5316418.1 hypothetical protein [Edaphobacter lichenicola]
MNTTRRTARRSTYFLRIALLLATLVSTMHAQHCGPSASNKKNRWKGLQPIVLLTEYNPWAMAICSDSPSFALYVDGTVIYWQGDQRSGHYVSGHLSKIEIENLLSLSHLDHASEFNDWYSIVDATDMPTNVLVVNTANGFKTVSVYGPLRHSIPDLPIRKLPSDLQTAFETLFAFRVSDPKTWQPPFFEVIIWPFAYAKSSTKWPADLPTVRDARSVQTKDGYNLFIPIAKLAEYKTFVAKLQPKQAVEINGKKWTTSARFPFPHE